MRNAQLKHDLLAHAFVLFLTIPLILVLLVHWFIFRG